MNCCGNNRSAWLQGKQQQNSKPHSSASQIRAIETIQFEYIGPTALTVVGPITNRRYRFSAPGAVLDIDVRDAASIIAVPHLKRARYSA